MTYSADGTLLDARDCPTYGEAFVKLYDDQFTSFARAVAPALVAASERMLGKPLRVLDVGCGTGRVAIAFARAGHEVVAADPSSAMLSFVRSATAKADLQGSVTTVQTSAEAIELTDEVDLVVATDAVLNHLPSRDALTTGLGRIANALRPGGAFPFDVFGQRALEEWNSVLVRDDADRLIVIRGSCRDDGYAWAQLSGVVRDEQRGWTRFKQDITARAITKDEVLGVGADCGFAETTDPEVLRALEPARQTAERQRRSLFALRMNGSS